MADESLGQRALDFIRVFQHDMDELHRIQEKSLQAYNRQPYGNEKPGLSKMVMSDVQETIEWMKPTLMRIFFGGADIVRINPVGPEDVEGAELLEKKVNFDLTKGLNGFLLFYDWFHDALLGKVGFVKYWWEDSEKEVEREFNNLTEAQFDNFEQFHPELNVKDANREIDAEGRVTFSIKGTRTRRIARPMAKVLPWEEFIGNIRAADFAKEDFVCHRLRKHKTEIQRDYGIAEDDIRETIGRFERLHRLHDERFHDLGGIHFVQDQVDKDYFFINECYINEYMRSGAKNHKVVLMGDTVIDESPNSFGTPPIISLSPIRLSHRAIGNGLAELVEDLQEYHTSLVRAINNNIYYTNAPLTIVNQAGIHTDDLLQNRRPGGIIRTKPTVPAGVDPQTLVRPLAPNALPPEAFNMLERLQGWKENRTGISRTNQGQQDRSINKTATGINLLLSASQQRMELIARTFAETGVKALASAFAQMNIDYLDEPQSIRFEEGLVTIDPAQFDVFFDTEIDVGLGTGSREVRAQQMMQLLTLTQNYLQIGIVTPENIANHLKVIYEQFGFKNTSDFLQLPESQPAGTESGAQPPAGGPAGQGQITQGNFGQERGGATTGESPDTASLLGNAGGNI